MHPYTHTHKRKRARKQRVGAPKICEKIIEFFFNVKRITTKKSSCPSVFFPAFLQTAVIDKPIPALFVGALQSAAIGGL